VRLGPSTPSDYVRARVLVPRNPGVTPWHRPPLPRRPCSRSPSPAPGPAERTPAAKRAPAPSQPRRAAPAQLTGRLMPNPAPLPLTSRSCHPDRDPAPGAVGLASPTSEARPCHPRAQPGATPQLLAFEATRPDPRCAVAATPLEVPRQKRSCLAVRLPLR
jgi:hypothetical protein